MVEDPELPTGMCWLTMTVYSSGAHVVGISLLEIYIYLCFMLKVILNSNCNTATSLYSFLAVQ